MGFTAVKIWRIRIRLRANGFDENAAIIGCMKAGGDSRRETTRL